MIMNKAIGVLCTFVAVIAIVGGYDFSDTYFNQYLAGELQDFFSSSEHALNLRNRRDDEAAKDEEKCRRRHGPPMCCGRELHDDIIDRDVKKQCFKEIMGSKDSDKPRGPPPDPFRCDNPHHRRSEMKCVFQCVGRKQNLLDENDQLKEQEIKDLFKNAFSKYDWTKSKEEIIDKCITETKEKMEEIQKNSTEKNDCSPALMMFSHCIFREIQMQCPDEEIKDKKMCAKIREDIVKYGDFGPPPPPPREMNEQ